MSTRSLLLCLQKSQAQSHNGFQEQLLHLPRLHYTQLLLPNSTPRRTLRRKARGRNNPRWEVPGRVRCSGCLSLVRVAGASEVRGNEVATAPTRSGSSGKSTGLPTPTSQCFRRQPLKWILLRSFQPPASRLAEERVGVEGTLQGGAAGSRPGPRSRLVTQEHPEWPRRVISKPSPGSIGAGLLLTTEFLKALRSV